MTQEILSKQLETQDDATRIVYLPTDKLRAFAEHPYKIIDNDEMASLVESIKTQGVLTPIVVRPMENGEYEIVSGHRRVLRLPFLTVEATPYSLLTYLQPPPRAYRGAFLYPVKLLRTSFLTRL